jgi:hypothetical protein
MHSFSVPDTYNPFVNCTGYPYKESKLMLAVPGSNMLDKCQSAGKSTTGREIPGRSVSVAFIAATAANLDDLVAAAVARGG